MNNNDKKYKFTLASIIGTTLEWYDFAIYGTLSPLLAQIFFPQHNPVVGLLYTFCIFASGFLIRPLGALWFGHRGDRLGRGSTFSLAILLMAIPTILIGCLPSYKSIGYLAPLFLILLRLWQGLSVSGEHSGAVIYLAETAKVDRRGFLTALCFLGVIAGYLLGTLLSALITHALSKQQVLIWGWRLPFFASFILGWVGYFLRKNITESSVFLGVIEQKKNIAYPIWQVLRSYKLNIICMIGALAITYTAFYSVFVYLPAYFVSNGSLKIQTSLFINIATLLLMISIIPVAGHLADKFCYKQILKIGAIGFIIFSYPLSFLLELSTVWAIFSAQFVFAILNAIYLGASAIMIVKLFPANVRYTGVAIGINITSVIFGALSPVVLAFIQHQLHSIPIIGVYITIIALLSYSLLTVMQKNPQLIYDIGKI